MIKLRVGRKVDFASIWEHNTEPVWLGGYVVDSYPEGMPGFVKVKKTRGIFAEECTLVSIDKIRVSIQKL